MQNLKAHSNIRTFFIKTFLIGLVFAVPFIASADSLIVEFENDPLFSESNFLPGSSVLRWAKVQNNSDFTQDILVEAINITDSDKFGDVLDITILEGDTELFNDTLSKFFNSGEIFLSALGAGEETEYDFKVSFKKESENDYQESTLGFDILIGFRGEGSPLPSEGGGGGGGGSGGDSGGGSGSGGYVIPPRGLVIRDESTIVTSISTTTASISWATSHKSTSRVIFTTTWGVFDFANPPNYGYEFSTLEFDTPPEVNGVTYHMVLLTGLTPATTYYYRVVSHASPPSIGVEKKFTTIGSGDVRDKNDEKSEEVFDGVGGEGALDPGSPYNDREGVSDKSGPSGIDAQSLGNTKKESGVTTRLESNEGEDADLTEDSALGAAEGEKEIESTEKDLFSNSTASLVSNIFSKSWLLIGLLTVGFISLVLLARKILKRINAQN